MTVFDEWGLEPIDKASEAVTRLGGAPMPALPPRKCRSSRPLQPFGE